jgi:hypothetical protein
VHPYWSWHQLALQKGARNWWYADHQSRQSDVQLSACRLACDPKCNILERTMRTRNSRHVVSLYLKALCMILKSAYLGSRRASCRPPSMAQPNVPVSMTGHIPPARLVRGVRAMQGDPAHSCYDRQAGGEHLMQSGAIYKWQVEMGWPDIHWLAWDKGGLVAAVLSLA